MARTLLAVPLSLAVLAAPAGAATDKAGDVKGKGLSAPERKAVDIVASTTLVEAKGLRVHVEMAGDFGASAGRGRLKRVALAVILRRADGTAEGVLTRGPTAKAQTIASKGLRGSVVFRSRKDLWFVAEDASLAGITRIEIRTVALRQRARARSDPPDLEGLAGLVLLAATAVGYDVAADNPGPVPPDECAAARARYEADQAMYDRLFSGRQELVDEVSDREADLTRRRTREEAAMRNMDRASGTSAYAKAKSQYLTRRAETDDARQRLEAADRRLAAYDAELAKANSIASRSREAVALACKDGPPPAGDGSGGAGGGTSGDTGGGSTGGGTTSYPLLDTTFDQDGKLQFDSLTTGNGEFRDAVGYGGGILFVGDAANTGASAPRSPVSVLTDYTGALKSSWNGSGISTLSPPGATAFDFVNRVAVDTLGRTIFVGALGNDAVVYRDTSGGTADSSCDGDGVKTIDFGGSFDSGATVAVMPNNDILVGAQGSSANGFKVAELSAGNCALNTGFGTNGIATVPIDTSTSGDNVSAILVEPGTSNIFVVGTTDSSRVGLTSLTSAGVLRTAFGTDGVTLTPDAVNTQDFVRGAAFDSSNRIVVVGAHRDNNNGTLRWMIARYTNGGALDTPGLVFTQVGAQDFAGATDLGFLPNGNIVVSGDAFTGPNNGDEDMAIGEFTPELTLVSSFGNQGTALFGVGPGNDFPGGLVFDPDGRHVYLAGGCRTIYGAGGRTVPCAIKITLSP